MNAHVAGVPNFQTASLIISATLAFSACASTATRLPDIKEPDLRAESILQENQTLATQATLAERLVRVGRPILRENAALCPKTRRDIGVTLHTEESYPKELRIAARRQLGATDEPSIIRVHPDSPASRAGLQPGDRIMIEGEPVGVRDKRLRAVLEDERVTLTIERDGQTQSVELIPETLCHSRLRLRSSSGINALADGRNIIFTTGMLNFVESDAELAFVVGHELAHNTMSHIRKSISNYILSGGATRYTRIFEREADYVGLYYMVRAGFDPDGVENFWRRLADVDPRSVNRAKTHPTFPERYINIAAARAEIRAKQEAGEPLIPNFKDAPNG